MKRGGAIVERLSGDVGSLADTVTRDLEEIERLVEFEGPGKDVRASNDVVDQPLGTSGRVTPEKNDIKTFLVHIKVDSVRPLTASCG